MSKKIISLLLALCMVFSCGVTVFAEYDGSGHQCFFHAARKSLCQVERHLYGSPLRGCCSCCAAWLL